MLYGTTSTIRKELIASMKIFLKYIAKSMFEKKGRLFLLIFAISISTALLIACSGIVSTTVNVYEESKKATAEGKDIGIVSYTDNPFFKVEDIKYNGIKNIDGEIRTTGVLKDDGIKYAGIIGREKNKIKKDYIIEGNISNLTGNNCIISKRICTAMNIGLGGTVPIYINGVLNNFKVGAISADDGLFYYDKPTQFYVLVDYKYMSELFKVQDVYNFATVNVASDNIKTTIKKFNDANSNFKAQKLLNEDMVTQQVQQMSSGLFVMFTIIILISILIIYGAFKLTIAERLPIIGTFFSQGATRRKVKNILLFESIGYGIVGGIVGAILGTGVLYLFNYTMSPLAEYGIRQPFEMNYTYILIGFIFAICLSLVSAVVPIRRIKKLSEKEVILNIVNEKQEKGLLRFVIGVVFLIIGAVGCFVDAQWTVDISMISLLVAIIGVVLAYRKIVDFVTGMLCRLIKGKSNILYMALNNVRSCRVLLDSIMLIIIALLCCLIIGSVADSMNRETVASYEEMSYDISIGNLIPDMTSNSKTQDIIKEISKVDGVDTGSISPWAFSEGSIDKMGTTIAGVKPKEFSGYNTYLDLLSSKNAACYQKFIDSTEKDIIVSNLILKKINKKVGDKVKITANDIEEEYTIVGNIDGKSFNVGNFVLMNIDNYNKSFHLKEAFIIPFKVNGDVSKIKEKITDIATKFGATCSLRENDMKVNLEESKTILGLISVFAYLSILISAIGVLNNTIIVFLQRKREFAILSSIGMSNGRRAWLLILESLIQVFWACLVTMPYSFVIIGNFRKFMEVFTVSVNLKLDTSALPLYCLVTAAIILISTIPVLTRSKKISVINELKYE